MGALDLTSVRAVALDTAPLIYYVEEHPRYLSLVEPLIEAIDEGRIAAYTSVITLIEVLVAPFRAHQQELVEKYKAILLHSKLHAVALTPEVAEQAADIRARYHLRIPDAVQVAVAVRHRVDLLLANDRRWNKVAEVKVVLLDDLLS